MRLSPKSSMAGVLRTRGFGCLPTEKAICVQGTDRVGTTSPTSGTSSSWKGFPRTMRDETCRLLDFRACCYLPHTHRPHCTRSLGPDPGLLVSGGRRFWCVDCSSHGVTQCVSIPGGLAALSLSSCAEGGDTISSSKTAPGEARMECFPVSSPQLSPS